MLREPRTRCGSEPVTRGSYFFPKAFYVTEP